MLIVAGVDDLINFTVSVTMLLRRTGFFSCSVFLLKASMRLINSRPRKPASMYPVKVAPVAVPLGEVVPDNLREPYYGGKDVVEVVGNAAGERAESLHFLGLAELRFDMLPSFGFLHQLFVRLHQLPGTFLDARLQFVVGLSQRFFGLNLGQCHREVPRQSLIQADPFRRKAARLTVIQLEETQTFIPHPQGYKGH